MVLFSPMSEKRKPAYDIDAIKAAMSSVDALKVTGSALRGAASLGYGRREIITTIQEISRRHFYKSMTSQADHRIWQDVYHVPTKVGVLYIKFTVDFVAEFLLLSFKEKGHD